MIIKTFTAESSNAALKLIRQELGGDAIVLKTREIIAPEGEKTIEVTACLEKPTASQASAALKSKQEAPRTMINRLSPTQNAEMIISGTTQENNDQLSMRIAGLEKMLTKLIEGGMPQASANSPIEIYKPIHAALMDSDVPTEFVDSIIETLIDRHNDKIDPSVAAANEIGKRIASVVAPFPELDKPAKVVFVGPAGSGKSSMLGKMAAMLITERKKKVKLVSLDDMKIGAIDEIGSYADLLGTDLIESSQFSKTLTSDSVVLVDTPALPTRPEKLEQLAKRIEKIDPDYIVAVFSALTRSVDMTAIAARVKLLKPTNLAITMTDLTPRHGGMLAAVLATGAMISMFSNSPGGTGNIITPRVEQIINDLLRVGAGNE